MTAYSEQFGAYFRDHFHEQIDGLVTQLVDYTAKSESLNPVVDEKEQKERITKALQYIADAMASGNKEAMIRFVNDL